MMHIFYIQSVGETVERKSMTKLLGFVWRFNYLALYLSEYYRSLIVPGVFLGELPFVFLSRKTGVCFVGSWLKAAWFVFQR